MKYFYVHIQLQELQAKLVWMNYFQASLQSGKIMLQISSYENS